MRCVLEFTCYEQVLVPDNRRDDGLQGTSNPHDVVIIFDKISIRIVRASSWFE